MQPAIANEEVQDMHEVTKQYVLQWFRWMDSLLSVHRSNFVFREVTPRQLEEHKLALGAAIRTCLSINTLIADPEFNEPDLVSRLEVRIQQLRDAYNTFHSALSQEEAEKILEQVFPE